MSSDAIVLFDGSTFSSWHHSKSKEPVRWILNNDKSFTIKPEQEILKLGKNMVCSASYRMKSPIENKGEGQSRGNSGIFSKEDMRFKF